RRGGEDRAPGEAETYKGDVQGSGADSEPDIDIPNSPGASLPREFLSGGVGLEMSSEMGELVLGKPSNGDGNPPVDHTQSNGVAQGSLRQDDLDQTLSQGDDEFEDDGNLAEFFPSLHHFEAGPASTGGRDALVVKACRGGGIQTRAGGPGLSRPGGVSHEGHRKGEESDRVEALACGDAPSLPLIAAPPALGALGLSAPPRHISLENLPGTRGLAGTSGAFIPSPPSLSRGALTSGDSVSIPSPDRGGQGTREGSELLESETPDGQAARWTSPTNEPAKGVAGMTSVCPSPRNNVEDSFIKKGEGEMMDAAVCRVPESHCTVVEGEGVVKEGAGDDGEEMWDDGDETELEDLGCDKEGSISHALEMREARGTPGVDHVFAVDKEPLVLQDQVTGKGEDADPGRQRGGEGKEGRAHGAPGSHDENCEDWSEGSCDGRAGAGGSRGGGVRGNQQGTGEEDPEEGSLSLEKDVSCCVCGCPSSDKDDPIIFCDGKGCQVTVHASCYGVSLPLPEGDWYCEPCAQARNRGANSTTSGGGGGGGGGAAAAVPRRSLNLGRAGCRGPKCVLCCHGGGALKLSTCGQWSHMVCVAWTPELKLKLEQDGSARPLALSRLDPDRSRLTCSLCHGVGGAAVQCAHPPCYEALHPSCALGAGFLLEVEGERGGFEMRCRVHSQARRRALAEAGGAVVGIGAGAGAGEKKFEGVGMKVSPAGSTSVSKAGVCEGEDDDATMPLADDFTQTQVMVLRWPPKGAGRGRRAQKSLHKTASPIQAAEMGHQAPTPQTPSSGEIGADGCSRGLSSTPQHGMGFHNVDGWDRDKGCSRGMGTACNGLKLTPRLSPVAGFSSPSPQERAKCFNMAPPASMPGSHGKSCSSAMGKRARDTLPLASPCVAAKGEWEAGEQGVAKEGDDQGGGELMTLSQADTLTDDERKPKLKKLRRLRKTVADPSDEKKHSSSKSKGKKNQASTRVDKTRAGKSGKKRERHLYERASYRRFIDNEAEVDDEDQSDDDEEDGDQWYDSQDSFVNDGPLSYETDSSPSGEGGVSTEAGEEGSGSEDNRAQERDKKKRKGKLRSTIDEKAMYLQLLDESPSQEFPGLAGSRGGRCSPGTGRSIRTASGRDGQLGFIRAIMRHAQEGGDPMEIEKAYWGHQSASENEAQSPCSFESRVGGRGRLGGGCGRVVRADTPSTPGEEGESPGECSPEVFRGCGEPFQEGTPGNSMYSQAFRQADPSTPVPQHTLASTAVRPHAIGGKENRTPC
ncbi:unnamed protein product, partial [Discosporangium mesarthrocarpum]